MPTTGCAQDADVRRGLSCRTPLTTSSTKPPGVSRPGRGARTILVSRIHINRRGSGRRMSGTSIVSMCGTRDTTESAVLWRGLARLFVFNHRRI